VMPQLGASLLTTLEVPFTIVIISQYRPQEVAIHNLISKVVHLEEVRLFALVGLLVVLGDLGLVLHVDF
jgi:hypothetical protein